MNTKSLFFNVRNIIVPKHNAKQSDYERLATIGARKKEESSRLEVRLIANARVDGSIKITIIS